MGRIALSVSSQEGKGALRTKHDILPSGRPLAPVSPSIDKQTSSTKQLQRNNDESSVKKRTCVHPVINRLIIKNGIPDTQNEASLQSHASSFHFGASFAVLFALMACMLGANHSSQDYNNKIWEVFRMVFNSETIKTQNGKPDILQKPRTFHLSYLKRNSILDLAFQHSFSNAGNNDQKTPKTIELSNLAVYSQLHLFDSDEYSKKPEPLVTDECEPQYQWQTLNQPTCNTLHELDLSWLILPRQYDLQSRVDDNEGVEQLRFIASGGYRNVFMVRDSHAGMNLYQQKKLALKTLKWARDFVERHFERHRKDAMAAARLMSKNSTSVAIFGYCGQSAIYEFAHGGNLAKGIEDYVTYPKDHQAAWNSTTKLKVAYQIATALADVHNVDQEGRASIAHTDISTDQFVSLHPLEDVGAIHFRINDFNRARFLLQSVHDNTQNCPFTVKSNKGKFRSPEEYAYLPETEKVDVYSMGNIFYVLVSGHYPFEWMSKKAVKHAVRNGHRPEWSPEILQSKDQYIQILVEATKMCWSQDPEQRATARQVQELLSKAWKG